ncbi:hypothetical protein OUZ56_014892 [Daphnia magna]|uniref:Uncharacterized protein n=1 Tax=Daphnia magna TaxID=35525 RepID=A0ABR0AL66_9CRUS|nr:hypothetical protein OUZ56_014892 [Daphnia magna]
MVRNQKSEDVYSFQSHRPLVPPLWLFSLSEKRYPLAGITSIRYSNPVPGATTTTIQKSCLDNVWNTKNCRDFDSKNCTLLEGLVDSSRTCHIKAEVSDSFWKELELMNTNSRLPADEYFHKHVLDISTGIHDLGPINWELALCLLLAWVCVFFMLLRQIKSFIKANILLLCSPT